MQKYPVIVALDGLSLSESLAVARVLKDHVWGYKVHELVMREGFGVIKKLKRFGKVFVDLKLHDIPHTVGLETDALVKYGADLISVHASGGREMLEAAVKAGGRRVVAITVLTSLPAQEARKAPGLASLARAAGVTNIVCSPQELGSLRRLSKTVTLITPGIRRGSKLYDQKRTMPPLQALALGADLLVIGRPITESSDHAAALATLFSPSS
ncbi:MAG: orotidine-5'-phosphate decarboxylase [Patescibacteria group bacterium]